MCLISQNIEPLVSDKDIVVYKQIVRYGNEYCTPLQLAPVKLGSVLKATGDFPKIDYESNLVGEGVIHTYINSTYITEHTLAVKAIIKAGTPFFVSVNMDEIAASEIYLDDHFETDFYEKDRYLEETRNIIYDILRERNTGNNNVKVGDILLSDRKTFIAPKDVTHKTNAIGIVSFIYPDGTPHIMGLKHAVRRWGKAANAVNTSDKPYTDLDGRNHTKRFVRAHWYDIADYPAFKYCVNYKTKGTYPGEWFLPAIGELQRTFYNTYLVNVSVHKLNTNKWKNYADKLLFETIYGSSTEDNLLNSLIYSDMYHISPCNKWHTCRIYPALKL